MAKTHRCPATVNQFRLKVRMPVRAYIVQPLRGKEEKRNRSNAIVLPLVEAGDFLFFGGYVDITTVSETRMLEMVFPDQTNHYGTLFGGHALRLMDMAAFVTASRYSRKSMVTASSERVDFSAPAKHGQLVELVGRVQRVGRTSVNVIVDMFAEDLLTGERHICATGNFTLVAVDESGQPTPIQGNAD